MTLIGITLASLWSGLCTAGQSGCIGVAGALAIAVRMGVTREQIVDVFITVARSAGVLMLLVFGALLYGRILAETGALDSARSLLQTPGIRPGRSS